MRVLLGSSFAVLLAGCATVQSNPVLSTPTLAPDAAGVTYFLPQKLVKLTISRAPVEVEKLEKARDAAQAALDGANKTKGEKKAAADHAQAVLDKLPADASSRADQTKVVELAKAEQAQADAAATKAEAELAKAAKAYLAALGSDAASSCSYDAKLELQPAQADPRRRYVAILRHNWLRDDTVKLAVTPAGLLTSANIVAADRTADIIIEAVGAAAGLGPTAALHSFTSEPPKPLDCGEPKSIVRLFDPTDAGVVSEVNNELIAAHYPYRVGVDPKAWISEQQRAEQGKADWTAAKSLYEPYKGALFYRSPVPVLLTLKRVATVDDKAQEFVVDSAMVALPQAGPISYIPANSSAFVKTVDDVVFVDGTIASWSPDRPSEVLEIVRLPVKVATAIISVPAQMLSLRVDYDSKAKSLADAQASQIAASTTLAKLRKCLADSQASGADGTACLPAATSP